MDGQLMGQSAPLRTAPPALSGVIILVQNTWQLYVKRAKTLLLIAAIEALASLVGGALIAITGLGVLFSAGLLSVAEKPPITLAVGGFAVAVFVVVMVLLIIISLWSTAAMLYAIKENDSAMSVQEAYRRGWQKTAALFWAGLLTGFVIAIGFILFIIPGIIFAIWFVLVPYVVVVEDISSTKALSRSRAYVKGHWWSVLWRFFVLWLILIVVSMVLGFIPVVGALVQFLLMPFAMIYAYLVYQELRALKQKTV